MTIPFFPLAVVIFIVGGHLAIHLRWRSLPPLDTYLRAHPHCRTGDGIKCAFCGSKSIRNWGVLAANDPRRSFACNSCGTKLYRSGAG